MDKQQQSLSDILKIMNDKQNKLAKVTEEAIKKISIHHITLIQGLIYRCGALETIQLIMFNALAEIKPLVHQRIVEELKESLKYIEEKSGGDTSFANHLRELVGARSAKKPHLRLVPKKSPPDTPEPDSS